MSGRLHQHSLVLCQAISENSQQILFTLLQIDIMPGKNTTPSSSIIHILILGKLFFLWSWGLCIFIMLEVWSCHLSSFTSYCIKHLPVYLIQPTLLFPSTQTQTQPNLNCHLNIYPTMAKLSNCQKWICPVARRFLGEHVNPNPNFDPRFTHVFFIT